MHKALSLGRPIFAVAMAGLGIQQLVYADFIQGPFIAPSWVPWRAFWACASGLVLLATAIGLVTGKWARTMAAVVMAVLLLLFVLLFHLPTPMPIVYDGIARTRAFETLTLCGAALVLAGTPPVSLGRLVFGFPMVVFGVQHFTYAPFVAAVEPAWMPGPLFWAYFTGVAFVAAFVAIVFAIKARLAAVCLGIMFGLWVLILHGPRVLAHIHDEKELNSALVALAFWGASWALAETLPGSP
jgi:uncharacterized membrane protein YphA (DoxX/SURF4 family)